MDILEDFTEGKPGKQLLKAPSSRRALVKVSGPQYGKLKRKKVFYRSRGSKSDRLAWNLDMRLRFAEKRRKNTEQDIVTLLASLASKTTCESIKLRRTKRGHLFTKSGLVKMACLKIKAHGNRHELKCSLEDFLKASFGDDHRKGQRIRGLRAQALAMNLAPSTVSCMRAVTFGAVMARQSSLLARLYLLCRMTQPLVVGLREAFDETSQKLVCKGELGEWTVMVLKHTLLILWLLPSGPSMVKIPIVCPSLPVLSPSADRLYYAIKNHPSLQTISKLEALILHTGAERIVLQETDAASANQRLYNFRLQSEKDDCLREMIFCHNHQNNLIEGSVVGTAQKSLISDFFSFTHFLQASSHFAKLKHAIWQYIADNATIVVSHHNVSPDHGQDDMRLAFMSELLDLHLQVKMSVKQTSQNRTVGGITMPDVEDAGPRSRLSKQVELFEAMWNHDGIGHVCARVGSIESWCCQSDDDAKAKLADSLLELAFSSVPETPAPGKWTKLWSCLQFVTFGYLFHNLLGKVLPQWLSTLKVSPPQKTQDDDDVDPALKATQEFAKITGKRAKKTEQFIRGLQDNLGFKLTVLSLVDEPLRFLTFFFMGLNDVSSNRSVLAEIVNPQKSPLIAALQHLSTLLFAESGRVLLLSVKHGYASVSHWEQSAPSEVRIFRRLVMLVIAWIQRRHCDRFMDFPFNLTLLSDPEASDGTKQQLLNKWDSKMTCCVRAGMARSLKKRGISSHDLSTEKWKQVLFAFSCLATCSVADCERKHGQHRNMCVGGQGHPLTFMSMLINSVNDEVRQISLRLQQDAKKRAQATQTKLEDVAAGAIQPSSRTVTPHGKQSGLHAFRYKLMAAEQSSSRPRRDWLSKDAWAFVKDEYSKLSAEERSGFNTAADMANQSINKKRKGLWSLVKRLEGADDGSQDVMHSNSSSSSDLPPILNACLSTCDGPGLKAHTGSVGDFIRHLQDVYISTGTKKEVNPWPIGQESILRSLLSLKCRKIQMKAAVKTLKSTCEATAGPKSENEQDIFPKTVHYAHHCLGVCACLGLERVRMQSQIIQALHGMASKFKSPGELVQADLLLSVVAKDSEEELSRDFFFVTAVAFRGGVQKPAESYVKLRPNKAFDVHRLLYIDPLPFVQQSREPNWPSPMNRASAGQVETFSTDQLAAYLVGSSDWTRLKVTIHKHNYEDVSRACVRVTGIAPDWDSIEIDSSIPQVKVAKPKPGGSINPPPIAADNSGVDMLEDFMTDEAVDPQQLEADARAEVMDVLMDALGLGQGDEEGQSTNPGPDWLNDFEGLLDPEQLEVLKEAEEFLRAKEEANEQEHPVPSAPGDDEIPWVENEEELDADLEFTEASAQEAADTAVRSISAQTGGQDDLPGDCAFGDGDAYKLLESIKELSSSEPPKKAKVPCQPGAASSSSSAVGPDRLGSHGSFATMLEASQRTFTIEGTTSVVRIESGITISSTKTFASVYNSDSEKLGYIATAEPLGSTRGLKAICLQHKQKHMPPCQCWIAYPKSKTITPEERVDLFRSLSIWISDGSTMNREDHCEDSATLRMAAGMQPRAKR